MKPRPQSACIQQQLAECTARRVVSRGTDSLITGLWVPAIESSRLRHARGPCSSVIERRSSSDDAPTALFRR